MACNNCGSNGGQRGMAPVGVNQQGFQQAQLYGNQFQPGSPGNQLPQSQKQNSGWGLRDTPGYNQVFPTLTPNQMALSNYSGQAAGNLISQGGGPDYSGFEPIAAYARNQFNTDTAPSLAERFTAMGGHGGLANSGFQGTIAGAEQEAKLGIAKLMAQYGQRYQGLQNQRLGTLLQNGLTNQLHNHYTEPTPGFFSNAAKALPYVAAAFI